VVQASRLLPVVVKPVPAKVKVGPRPTHSSLGSPTPQRPGVQVEFAPWKTPGETQAVCAPKVQHVTLQQAPETGWGQGFGVQVTLPRVKTEPTAVQPEEAVIEHAPEAVTQHEPTLGQGLGSQTELAPWKVPVQAVLSVVVQTPVALQQAPETTALMARVKGPPTGAPPNVEMRTR